MSGEGYDLWRDFDQSLRDLAPQHPVFTWADDEPDPLAAGRGLVLGLLFAVVGWALIGVVIWIIVKGLRP